MSKANPRNRAEHALRKANRAAKSGDAAKAERWSKTAERLTHSMERLMSLPPAGAEDDDDLKAELRRRLARFVEADLAMQRWEIERETYEANLWAAVANGTEPPPPLSPHPAGALGEEAYMTNILVGPEPDDGLVR